MTESRTETETETETETAEVPGQIPPGDDGRKFFGRRHGRRLGHGRKAALEAALSRFGISALPVDAAGVINPSVFFDFVPDAVELEIGFGNGEHLAAQARAHPRKAFIGCEPFVNGISALAQELLRDAARNVRIYPDDAKHMLDALAPATLDRIYLLHPDPWPKKRHHKRRFIQPDTVARFAALLKPGGELRLASDDAGLVDWMLWHVTRSPDFEWLASCRDDWHHRPDDWPGTRYGEKALAGVPAYLRFVRRKISPAAVPAAV